VELTGVILAAGRGSRLGDASAELPKPLMPVAGRTCIDFAIDALLKVVSRVVVVVGYRAELVEAHLANAWGDAPVTAVRNPELEAGNLTSLRAARVAIGSGPFIVTNADHLFPVDMYSRWFTARSGVSIACEKSRPILEDEMKVVEQAGRLVAISKTLPRYDGAYIGTTAVAADVTQDYWQAFDEVAATADLRSASVEMVLDRLAAAQTGVRSNACSAATPQVRWIEGLNWYEVDTPEDLAVARESLAQSLTR